MTTLKEHIRESILSEGIFDFLKKKPTSNVRTPEEVGDKVVHAANCLAKVRYNKDGNPSAATQEHHAAFHRILDGTHPTNPNKLDPDSVQHDLQSWGSNDADQDISDLKDHLHSMRGNPIKSSSFHGFLHSIGLGKVKDLHDRIHSALNPQKQGVTRKNTSSGSDDIGARAVRGVVNMLRGR